MVSCVAIQSLENGPLLFLSNILGGVNPSHEDDLSVVQSGSEMVMLAVPGYHRHKCNGRHRVREGEHVPARKSAKEGEKLSFFQLLER